MGFVKTVFGKKRARGPAIPQHPGPDDDGITRVIPKAVFEGEAGDFLRKMGQSPDDASNMMPDQQLVQARHDAAFAQQTKFIDQVNSQLPEGTSVGPYAMLPWELWKGEFAPLLMTICEYYPSQPWNTMLLPDDERSSMVLDLPVHPGHYPPNLVEAAEKHLARFRAELNDAHGLATESLESGRIEMSAYGEAVDKLKSKVVAVSNTFTSITFGEDVYDKHLKIFGKTLGWSHADKMLENRK